MKQFLIAGALSATVMAGMAFAAQPAPPAPNAARGPMGDGMLTREEAMTQADKRFDRLDFNRDGKVSEETMMAAHAGQRGHGMRGRGMNGAGMRGRGAHRGPEGMGAEQRPDPAARMAEMRTKAHERFAALDANNDGKVDAAERFAARGKMREQHRQMRGQPASKPSA